MNYTFSFLIPLSDDMNLIVNQNKILIATSTNILQVNCYSNLNCKQVIYNKILISGIYTEISIIYYHYQGAAFIYNQYKSDDSPTIINYLNVDNSLGMTQISQDSYLINIYAI